jgi:acyl-CoA synthetase (AMP-forming)/AMP-acid ligase II
MDENFATLWESLADVLPEHEAIVVGDRRITWRELDDRSARLAAALAELGVTRHDTVALYLYNCPEYLECVYAAFKVQGVPVNVNYRYLDEELVYLLRDSAAEVLVFHGSLGERVVAVRDRIPGVVLVQVDDGSPLVDGAHRYEDLVAGHEAMARAVRSGQDHLVLYTGGTTGMPKGVVWAHDDLFTTLGYPSYTTLGLDIPTQPAQVGETALKVRELGGSPVTLSGPPLMHGTALFLCMSTFLLAGTVVLLQSRRFDPDEMLRLVQREGVTQLIIVGDAFARPLTEALERADAAGRPYDLSSLKRISSSGMMWSAPLKKPFMDRGEMVLLDMLGASEGGPFAVAVSMPGDDPATATFKIADRCVVFDEDWKPIPHGTGKVGVLGVSGVGPLGYHGDAEKSAATYRMIDGVRFTVPGDYALVDADGTLHLLGRGSVCINTGGEKVYPEEVEEAAKLHPAVVDCNAVGVPDDRLGEAVTLVVALKPGAEAEPGEIIDFVKGHIAGYKAPRHVVMVDEIRRSGSGKADYRWAKAAAADALGLAS